MSNYTGYTLNKSDHIKVSTLMSNLHALRIDRLDIVEFALTLNDSSKLKGLYRICFKIGGKVFSMVPEEVTKFGVTYLMINPSSYNCIQVDKKKDMELRIYGCTYEQKEFDLMIEPGCSLIYNVTCHRVGGLF